MNKSIHLLAAAALLAALSGCSVVRGQQTVGAAVEQATRPTEEYSQLHHENRQEG
jgi:outer membrane protein assembly factor BamE (lipoprotein component of BamABCDE complex)